MVSRKAQEHLWIDTMVGNRFQEGCVSEKKKTPEVSMQHVGDTVIYSEDPSGTSLIYLEDDSGRRVTTNHDTSEPIVIYDSALDQELTSKELRKRHSKTRQEAEYPIVKYDSRLDPEWKETRNYKETPRYLAQLLREHFSYNR